MRDLVGLYMNPPDMAVVLCVDHKSQIQALDRTAPILPLMPGVPQRRTHDYKRNGTTNLRAALDCATGKVITSMTRRNRAQEFQKFLNRINREVPDHLEVHIVSDNASTHKTEPILNPPGFSGDSISWEIMEYGKTNNVFTGGSGAGCPDGFGASGGLPV